MLERTNELVFVLALSMTAPLAAQNDQSGPRSIADGIYTVEQALRGEQINEELCSNCHMESWFTETLMQSWSGAPLKMLYEVISTTMPEDNPGGLRPTQYAEVLAYIFRLNGMPPGNEELSVEKDALDNIIIQRN